jgi:hypothetical protein
MLPPSHSWDFETTNMFISVGTSIGICQFASGNRLLDRIFLHLALRLIEAGLE